MYHLPTFFCGFVWASSNPTAPLRYMPVCGTSGAVSLPLPLDRQDYDGPIDNTRCVFRLALFLHSLARIVVNALRQYLCS